MARGKTYNDKIYLSAIEAFGFTVVLNGHTGLWSASDGKRHFQGLGSLKTLSSIVMVAVEMEKE